MNRHLRSAIFIGSLAGMALVFSRCAGSSSSATTSLTTAGKITTGLGSAATKLQGLGTALSNGNSTFSNGQNQIQSPTTNCTANGEPGEDTNLNGTVSDSEKYGSSSSSAYALTKFYCTLAASSNGPETVSGAVRLVKTVACAVEKQLGSISFDNNPVSLTSLTLDTTCATAEMLQDMNGGDPTTSVTMAIPMSITAALNPTFSEIPGNTFYSHGIRIASNDGTSLKFIILAKFDDTISGDPIESGDFEFVTFGTGTQMQGTAVEYTAGKINRSSSTSGTLWYESRINRIKSSLGDALCQPGSASSSCGFARHTRLRTDISFSGGDISDVSSMSGIIVEGYDSTGSGQSGDGANIVTATGSLTSGLSGKAWTANPALSPADFSSTTLAGGAFPSPVVSCISGGGSISTSCGGMPTPLEPGTSMDQFAAPANSSTWIQHLSTNGGLGFSGAVTFADAQSAL
jgi:hypothetical protein